MDCYRKSEMGMLALAVLAILFVGGTRVAEGQSIPPCATSLAPCVDYLNATSPPDTCCSSIRQTVDSQFQCLCSLLNNPTLLEAVNITVTQAVEVSRRCNITVDPADCSKFLAPSPSSSVPSTPGVPGNDNNGVGKMAWTGMSSLLLFWASMVVIGASSTVL